MSSLIAQLLDTQDAEPVPCSCAWQLLLENALKALSKAADASEMDDVALDTHLEVLAILRALQDARVGLRSEHNLSGS